MIRSPRNMRQALMTLAFVAVASSVAAQDVVAPWPVSADSGATSDRGLFRKLFATLARDIKALPAKDNRPILLKGAVFAIGMYPMDDIATYAASSSRILKASFGGFGKAIGREWIQGGGALGGYILGRAIHNRRLVETSGDLIEAQLVSVAVTQATKFAVRRTRPDGEARSFPSGHASAAFATAATLQRHYGAKVAVPAYLIAAYTSASRLQANSHYASDVIAGAALGLAIGRTATMQIGSHRLQVTPTPVSGGVGIVVSAAHD